MILNKPTRARSLPLFQQLKILPFPDRIEYQMCGLIYKAIDNLLPDNITHYSVYDPAVIEELPNKLKESLKSFLT